MILEGRDLGNDLSTADRILFVFSLVVEASSVEIYTRGFDAGGGSALKVGQSANKLIRGQSDNVIFGIFRCD